MASNISKKVIVIGAGLGGLSAAISLALKGFPVHLFEKNDKVGGKLNVLKKDGFSFDLGPSILTLPHYFRRLWTRTGRRMEEDVTIETVTPHWRNFFEDGTVVDLHMDPVEMKRELTKLSDPGLEKRFFEYLEYSAEQYDLIEKGYFENGLDTKQDFVSFYKLKNLLKIDYWTTMHKRNKRRLKNPYLIDIMDYFIKYVGSSALNSPAFMNLMPTIQFRYDLWYVKGGMYNLAIGMERLAKGLGVEISLNAEVTEIERDENRVKGIRLADGSFHASDIIVSNMEVIPAYEKLLKEDDVFMDKLKPFEPACSGLVLHLGTNRPFPQLAHHNFFFAKDQEKHFRTVFDEGRIPEDPTLYVVAPSRTDTSVCPEGCDNIKILPHIPHLKKEGNPSREDYIALRNRILEKMERTALPGLRESIITEDMWTPEDIQRRYYSNGGSIYGVVSDRKKNFAMKCPKKSTKYTNLYFTGGSVNPGGGMPMVVLSGQNVADMIDEDLSGRDV
ncbi:MAG: phytoene desaturase [Deltaproteobacteria bacterium]|nr:phytoene desaturase [Deltaproteobacteria bacterium]